MDAFYTNIRQYGKNLLYIGYDKNGERVKKKTTFSPILYIESKEETNVKSINGKNLHEMNFEDFNETKDFIKTYKDTTNFSIYGQDKFNYQYITRKWPKEVPYDLSLIRAQFIDIEVYSPDEFPSPDNAIHPIPCLTLEDKKYKQIHIWYYNASPTKFDPSNLKYIDLDIELIPHGFETEKEMLLHFLSWYDLNTPDILSGWYSRGFDIPYLYNRLKILFSDNISKKLSPWKIIQEKKKQVKRNNVYSEEVSYDLYGINEIDYMDLYMKYTPNGSESYKLDFIAKKHLGVGKLEFDGSLNELFNNDFQRYCEYNIIDVRRISQLEDELLYLELLMTVSYAGKVATFADSLGTVKYWEILIYNYLNENNIQPAIKTYSGGQKDDKYAGGYVKDPVPSMKEWVVSWDYTSLYPSIIRQVNIGPETQYNPKVGEHSVLPKELEYIQKEILEYDEEGKKTVSKKLINREIDLSALKRYGVGLAANGTFYCTTNQSFLSSLMEKFFNKRKEYQKIAKTYEKQLSEIKDKNSQKYKEIETLYKQFDIKQYATKILINSAYGGLGNKYFAYYALDNAEAVTLTGQLVIQWIERKINEWMNNILKTKDIDYVVYIDTDSVTIDMKDIVKQCVPNKTKKEICEFLDKVCKEKLASYVEKSNEELCDYLNNREQRMFLNREMIADKAVWRGKKTYCMNVLDKEGVPHYDDPYLKIMGMEVVKSSTPAVCREKLKEAVAIILQKDEAALIKHIENFREEFFKLPVEMISFPRSVSELDKWTDASGNFKSGIPIHVRGSVIYNRLLKLNNLDKNYEAIKDSSKILFCYLKMPNLIHENVISFKEDGLFKQFGLHEYIDYETQFQKTFLDVIESLTNVIGWKTEDVNTLDI